MTMKPEGIAAEARRARARALPIAPEPELEPEPDVRDDDDDEEEAHRRAFGDRSGLCLQRRAELDRLRRGCAWPTRLGLVNGDVRRISDGDGWELLGRYVARSAVLVRVEVDGVRFGDDEMSGLFGRWTGGPSSSSVTSLAFTRNRFGAEGVKSMAPLLQNARVEVLKISRNDRFDANAFRSLARALDGGPLKHVSVQGCHLVDVKALRDRDLSCLETLDLARNDIRTVPALDNCTGLRTLVLRDNDVGREGSAAIAHLLRGGSSPPALTRLDLSCNRIDDEGAAALAGALRRNATLRELRLECNLLEEDGMRVLLRMLCDVSSIAHTYRSNHVLTDVCVLPQRGVAATSASEEIAEHIAASLTLNGRRDSGRTKVVATQLDGERRRGLCRVQGVPYACYGRILVEVDPIVLPDLLAVAGRGPPGGRTRVYRILVAAAPGLASLVDGKGSRSGIAETTTNGTAAGMALEAERAGRAGPLAAADSNRAAAQKATRERLAVARTAAPRRAANLDATLDDGGYRRGRHPTAMHRGRKRGRS